jgi:hypothetical protein
MSRVEHLIVALLSPRAMELERLAELAQRYDCPVKVVQAVEDALEEGLRLAVTGQYWQPAASLLPPVCDIPG